MPALFSVLAVPASCGLGPSVSLRSRKSLSMAWCDGMEEARVLISPVPCTINAGEGANSSTNTGCILSLLHPKSGIPVCYVLAGDSLQELHWYKQSFGSWFLGDYVCEDGSLYITTPVDPIFILLPLFEVARMKKGNDLGMFRQLDEILYVQGYPGYQKLMCMAESSMPLVCEVKEIGSSKFFRLNDSKVLAWLCCKVHNLKAELIKLDKNYAVQGETERLRDIVALLGEYLKDDPWLMLLCGHLQLDVQEICSKVSTSKTVPVPFEDTPLTSKSLQGKNGNRKSISGNEKQSKKMKTETNSHNIKDMFHRASRR